MAQGIQDLKNVALPSAWDGNELSRLRLRDGTTYGSLVADIDAALSVVNGSLNSGYLGRLLSLTTEPNIEYRSGGTNGFEDETEQTQPDSQHAETTGHMLPLLKKDRGMKWTESYLEEARRASIDAGISAMVEDAVNIYEKSIWTRFFKMEEETGKSKGLGATGYSVPFADGGNGTIAYIPTPRPDRLINPFTTAHNHFLRLDGITQANLEIAVGHLWEHGMDAPYDLIVSLADLGAWQNTTNVTGFKPKADSIVQYGGLDDLALVESEIYQGAVLTKYGSCRLYANARIPSGYWGVTKSFGQNDMRNPLKVRYDDFYGSFGVKLVTSNVSLYPFTGAIAKFRFGVGIGESRVGGVLVKNDVAGDYATPTIS
jgi:hypothetical protein